MSRLVANTVSSSARPPTIWTVLPASGIGARMGVGLPKQYLSIMGKPIIIWTLEKLWQVFDPAYTVVALNADDQHWQGCSQQYHYPDSANSCDGGGCRAQSVLNALSFCLQSPNFTEEDWVLVHDAVRPCVPVVDLEGLKSEVALIHRLQSCSSSDQVKSSSGQAKGEEVGFVLGLPVVDSLKEVDDNGCIQTAVSRDCLWRALTPQLFPLQLLHGAISDALAKGYSPTDESQAVQMIGEKIKMIRGSEDNAKVTHLEDLPRIERVLRWQLDAAGE